MKTVDDLHLNFPVYCELSLSIMRDWALFVTNPLDYVHPSVQPNHFSEPGWFLVTSDYTIRSLSISSSPAAGRVLPDQFDMLLEWNDSRSAADNKYAATRYWGSA